ncbi:MAG: universal stress protein [Bacteroidia bacterium]
MNIEHSKTILAPTDFSDLGMAAMKHANIFAEKLKKKVTLLHVIPDYDLKAETLEKLKPIAEANRAATGIETEYTTSTGTIFEQIGQAADILNAAFVVMGTHGIKGMQKITGSFALKVITKSNKPYIVVQKDPPRSPYQNIIIPITHTPKSKQALFHILHIAKLFDATCHIYFDFSKDSHLDTNIKNNVAYAENFLTENGIKNKSIALGQYPGSFNQAFLNYAKNNNADLITLVTEQNISLVEFLMRPAEQYVIANEAAIPVMCIHPDYNALKFGSVFTQ